jgi:hypothetical protein
MADLINLRRARKAKTRADKDKTAQANRVAHGTPKALRKLEDTRREKELSRLDAKKLDGDS